MAKVNICNVEVRDNPCAFNRPFQFEITFECIEDLNEDLEWKIIYVGSAESEEFDQTLDSVVVGPIVAGRHMFVFEADPPDPRKIPREDAIGVTVVLLTCSYRTQEFVRVGYYVNIEYADPELKENQPQETDFSRLQRNILATSPRVTRFKIDWGDGEDGENVPPPNNTENESNQMAIDPATTQVVKEETMDGPLKSDSCSNSAQVMLNGTAIGAHCGADSNGVVDISLGKPEQANSTAAAEPMQI